MGLATSDILNLNLPIPLRSIKVIQGPTIFLSSINIDVNDIYTSLNAIMVKLHFIPIFLQKRQDSWAINTP
jgi:hypothetical protein